MSNPAITAALIAASRQQEVEEAIEGRLREGQGHGPVERNPARSRQAKQKELLDQALAAGTVKTDQRRALLSERASDRRPQGRPGIHGRADPARHRLDHGVRHRPGDDWPATDH